MERVEEGGVGCAWFMGIDLGMGASGDTGLGIYDSECFFFGPS